MGSNMEGNWQLILERQAAEKPISLNQGSSFKRTFPFDSSTGTLLINSPTLEEERLLQQHSYNYTGVKLLRGLWQERLLGGHYDSSGTHFPVAAPEGETLWCSAGHCLMPSKQQHWRCGYGQEVMPISPASAAMFRTVVDLSWLTDGLSDSELSEVTPSAPHRPTPAAAVMPNFGFILINSPVLQPTLLFIPCADQLSMGKPVCMLGFAAKPTVDWAQTFLRTQADYDEYKLAFQGQHHKDPPPYWELESNIAFQRTLDLLDHACFPNKLAAAPGQVVAATDRIVEHSCSSFPGMSGAPGVDIQAPWKLLFIHTRADSDFRYNVNYGYSINHPLFVKAYVREVLPKLLNTPRTKFQPGMLECLHNYLSVHQDKLTDATVLDKVKMKMLSSSM